MALFVLAAVGNKLLGRPTGWVAALIFAAVPAFSFEFTDLTVESTELLFIFAGLLALLDCETKGRAVVGGLAFALAFQTRETSIVATIFVAIFMLMHRTPATPKLLAWASAGFLIPLLVEFATFAVSTGDPFWRRQLDMHHELIQSSELLGPVDTKHGPFFNLAYIAHWRNIAGIHIHWSVDWLLNLIFSGTAGLSLILPPLLLLVARDSFSADTKRTAFVLWLTGLAYAGILALVFALDPKPRIMLVPLALASASLALLTWRAKQDRYRLIAYGSWAAICLQWLPIHVGHRRTDLVEGPAMSWISQRPNQVEIDENTRRHLALVPAAEALPGVAAMRRYFLYMSSHGCVELIGKKGLPGATVSPVESAPVNLIYLVDRPTRTKLCLLRFNSPVTANEIVNAIRQSRSDGTYITGYAGH